MIERWILTMGGLLVIAPAANAQSARYRLIVGMDGAGVTTVDYSTRAACEAARDRIIADNLTRMRDATIKDQAAGNGQVTRPLVLRPVCIVL